MKKLLFLFLIAISFASAENKILKPDEKEFIAETQTSIRIACTKKKSSVYINDEYFGTTPLTVTDLTPATYILRVEKSGFAPKSFLIEIKRGLHQEYFVEL